MRGSCRRLKALQAQAEKTEIEKLKALDKERGIPYTPPKPLTPGSISPPSAVVI